MLRPSKTENISLSLINDQIKRFPTDANAKITFKRIHCFVLFSSANATDARNVLHPRPEQVDLVPGHLRQLRSSRNQKRINSTDAFFLRSRKEEFKQT